MATTSSFRVTRIFGIPIYVDPSWLIIFFMITWTLASQYTYAHPRWTPVEHWTLGILTSLLFFASVLFHELSHSLVARLYKIRVASITLFVFGGVARITKDAPTPLQEFNIAIAGPTSSALLALGFFGLKLLFSANEMANALATWLAWTNLLLAGFNLLPGFPLDGGRVFRALVWAITKDFPKATRIAGATGKLVAYGMIGVGAWEVFQRQWGGLWWVLIGFFLLNAAQQSVAQVAVREALYGLRAADVMSHEVPIVPRHISLEEYGQQVLRTGRRCHLVVSDEALLGMMNVHTLNSVPREEWAHTSVQGVMIPREKILWASPDEPLLGLLERLLNADVNQMPVVSSSGDGHAHIIGMITRDSILRVMQARSELGAVPSSR